MIHIKQKGDFSNTEKYLKKSPELSEISVLDKYGMEGIEALKLYTPKDSGETANSWYYNIERKNGEVSISFNNSKVNNGVVIAVILYYGHATNNGGWVQGIDYINPALKPVFEKIAQEAWKEVRK